MANDMMKYGIASLIGEGMKGFADSFTAEKDRQRKQAEADDEKSRRNRQMEASDFDAGRVWDEKAKAYKKADGANPLDANEQKQYTMLTQLANSQGEMWQHETNRPYREALNRLIQKSMGGMFPTPPTANPNALLPREPDTTARAPKKKTNALLPRQAQIAQTEALGSVPAAKAPVADSPYAPLKKKIMARHDPSYGDASKWVPGFLPKAERDQRKQNEKDIFNLEVKEAERAAAPMEKMQGELAGTVANQAAIASSIKQGLDQLNDPSITEEQKIVIGREMLKTLNSQQGKDAIGAEEAKRLGGLLEYRWLNLTEPGPWHGRDVPAFTEQVKNNYNRLQNSIKANEGLLSKAKRGESLAAPEATRAPQAPQAPYQPGQTIYIDGVAHKVSADGKSADPL